MYIKKNYSAKNYALKNMCVLHHHFSKSGQFFAISTKRVTVWVPVSKFTFFYVKLSKCEFGKTSLNYLGHIVGGGELKIDPSKVAAIVN